MPISARPLATDEFGLWADLDGPLARALRRGEAARTGGRAGCLLLWDGERAVARVRLGHDSRLAYLLSFGLAAGAEPLGAEVVRTAVSAVLAGQPPRPVFAAYDADYAPHFAAAGFRPLRRRIAMVARITGRQATEAGPTPPGPRLRHPKPAEAAALGGLAYRAYRGGIDDNDETEQDLVEEIRASFSGGLLLRAASRVAWRGGEPLGACLMARFQGWPLVAHLVVAPAARGRGLGRRLLRASLDDLAGLGERDALLFVTLGNPAERLYRALGFARVGPAQCNGLLTPGP